MHMKTAWWEQSLLCLTVLLGELQMDLVKEEGVVHGAVHAGFYEALFFPLMDPEHSVFQKICIALVAALKDNQKKLFITGHSLGEWACKASLQRIACLASLVTACHHRHRRRNCHQQQKQYQHQQQQA